MFSLVLISLWLLPFFNKTSIFQSLTYIKVSLLNIFSCYTLKGFHHFLSLYLLHIHVLHSCPDMLQFENFVLKNRLYTIPSMVSSFWESSTSSFCVSCWLQVCSYSFSTFTISSWPNCRASSTGRFPHLHGDEWQKDKGAKSEVVFLSKVQQSVTVVKNGRKKA